MKSGYWNQEKKRLEQNEIASKLKISQPAVSSFYTNALKKIRNVKKTIDFLKFSHAENQHNRFDELLLGVGFHIKNKRIDVADRLYHELLEDYRKLARHHINEKLRTDIHSRIKEVHKNLCKAIIKNKRAVIKTKV